MLQQPRTDQIRLRVSPTEKAKIAERAKASGLGVSEYVRSLALGEVEVGAVEPRRTQTMAPVAQRARVSRATSAATPGRPAVESSPPAPGDDPPADDDLEARIAARARQLHVRMSKSAALAQARRELS